MERLIDNIEKFDKELKTIPEFFYQIRKILVEWIDFNEPLYYDIVALWILGTWFHDDFYSFPYLFINAMKQSGKSRLLKLISALSRKGFFTSNLTESVLFRLPTNDKGVTLCIDEAERISYREKGSLRELLNAGYKKGLFIARSLKIANGKWVIEKFEAYTPIALANIGGIDDVLEDRCISIPLERSTKKGITGRLEIFEVDTNILFFNQHIKNLVQLCNEDRVEPVYKEFNNYYINYISSSITSNNNNKQTEIVIKNMETTPITTPITTPNTTDELLNSLDFLEKINQIVDKGIIGRNLEIWFPLFFLAFNIDKNLFSKLLDFVIDVIKEKSSEDAIENRDMILLSFLLNNFYETDEFITIRSIVTDYKNLEPEDQWFNSRWVGRALRRNHIVKEKRRLSKGFEVIIDFENLKKICKKLNIEKNKEV